MLNRSHLLGTSRTSSPTILSFARDVEDVVPYNILSFARDVEDVVPYNILSLARDIEDVVPYNKGNFRRGG